MKFYSRRLIKNEDLNPANRLFGGRLLEWIDEEAAIYVACQLNSKQIVTKYVSEINFVSSAHLGDVIEFGMEVTKIGRSSVTIKCLIRNKESKQVILAVEEIVFVCVDENGKTFHHGLSQDKVA